MLSTKYVLMFVVLSAGMLTGLTATGMSLGQTAFASERENYKSGYGDKDQKIDQENHCKIVISNEHGDDNRQNDNDNDLTCQNLAQNAKNDASVDGDPFSESD
jgi:hypothetical protein